MEESPEIMDGSNRALWAGGDDRRIQRARKGRIGGRSLNGPHCTHDEKPRKVAFCEHPRFQPLDSVDFDASALLLPGRQKQTDEADPNGGHEDEQLLLELPKRVVAALAKVDHLVEGTLGITARGFDGDWTEGT